MPSTIITKNGSGAPLAADLVAGELAVDLTNGRLYTEDSGGSVIEIGLNPSGNLDVTGTVSADGLTVDSSSGITVNGPTDQDGKLNLVAYAGVQDAEARIQAVRGNTSGTDSRLQFLTNNGTSLLTRVDINDNGNISFYDDTGVNQSFFWDASAESLGIGTVSPSGDGVSIHVASTTSNSTLHLTNSTTGGTATDGTYITTSGNDFLIRNREAGYVATYTSNTERMRIDSSGNVGIGLTDPSSYYAKNLVVAAADEGGITIECGDTEKAYLMFADGTSGNTAYRGYFGYDHSVDSLNIVSHGYMNFYTDDPALERMRIDASGNVGIGTDSQDSRLVVQSPDNTLATDIFKITSQNAAAGLKFGFQRIEQIGPTNPITFNTGGSEAMQIDSSGNLLVGTTSLTAIDGTPTTTGIGLRSTGSQLHSVNNGGNAAEFRINGVAGAVGSINCSGTTTSYVTSSDQRLKENIVDAPSASDDIDAIQVRSFDWKVNGSHQKYGMIAQELQTVAPEAVSAPEDPDEMMGVDYSKLVPMMLKEIQSLRARVAELESK